MHFRIYEPATALAPYVKQYYHLQSTNDGFINLPQQLFSLGDLYMVFLQEGEVIFQPTQHASFTLPAASVVGHFTCHHQIRVKGPVKMTVIQLNAYGCYRLAGLNMSAFNNYFRDLLKQHHPCWQDLSQQLADHENESTLHDILDQAFLDILCQYAHPLKQVDEIAEYIIRHEGYTNIMQLTKKFKLSRHTLERKFMEVIGLTPQLYARMLRFRDAMQHMQQMSVAEWQSFITTNDSYSQALFIQDFLFFKGETPVLNQDTAIAQMPVTSPVAVAS
jgi:AraC-like DNA-binding protein